MGCDAWIEPHLVLVLAIEHRKDEDEDENEDEDDDEHSAEIQPTPFATAVALDTGDSAGNRPGGGGLCDGHGAGSWIDGDLRQHRPTEQLGRPPQRRAGRVE